MTRPLVYLAVPPPAEVLARIEAECDVVKFGERGKPSKPDILGALGDVDGVLSTTRVPFDAELLATAPRLRVVSNFGVGYDNVDVGAATERGVLVCNTPGVLTDAVADLTMGLIIALARRLIESERLARGGEWMRGAAQLGVDVRSKTLGIIGLGRIGRAVAHRARAFGMQVCFHDQFRDAGDEHAFCQYQELDDLLQQSDFVTLHINLTAETGKLISVRELALMKPTAYLINTSRGQVIDQPALVEALRENAIAGAALDVLDHEPPDPDDPILQLPNAIVLPHIGSATRETRMAMLNLAVDNLLAALRGETPACLVNPEVLASLKLRDSSLSQRNG